MKQTVRALVICLVLAGVAALALVQGAPAVVAWPVLGFFGLAALGLSAAIANSAISKRRRADGCPPEEEPERLVLKDGRDYRVEADDTQFALAHLGTGEKTVVGWDDVTSVFVVTADALPVGRMSYVIHRHIGVVEVPLGAAGNEAFLARMQEKLPGFDNDALIEGMAMLQGFKQVWPERPATDLPPAAAPA